ncbi:hypothetical protein SAMN05428936_10920 [Pelagibacterium halotolerans]|nr:hypothetical protein SAMN05428936_10920 [Pelagibacterium halotolerans]
MSRADMPDRLAIPRDAKPRDMGAHQTRRVSAGKANRLAAPRTFGKRRDVRLAKIDRAIGQESHRIEPAGKIIVPRLDYGNRIGRVGRGIDGGHENRNRRRSGISNALERTGSDCRPLPGGEQKRAKAVTCSGAGNIELLLVHRAVGRDGLFLVQSLSEAVIHQNGRVQYAATAGYPGGSAFPPLAGMRWKLISIQSARIRTFSATSSPRGVNEYSTWGGTTG